MLVYEILTSCLFGAIFGSFSTFLGYRLFNQDSSVKLTGKHSMCCNCKHKLAILDLIPVLSFIFLKGKCRYCKQPIPVWHFLAEITMIYCFSFATYYFNGINAKSTLMFLICFCLTTQAIIDIRVMYSSDILHIITLFATSYLSILLGYSVIHIAIMILSTLILFIFLAFIMKFILKKECIGFGDIKLFFVLSPLFTVEKLPILFGICGFVGIIFYLLLIKIKQIEKRKQFPYIPVIFFSFLLAFYF